MQIKKLDSQELHSRLEDLAGLRLTIFREYPYLYDGTLEDELSYVSHYAEQGMVLIALDGNTVAAAVTGMPLDLESEPFQQPFRAADRDPGQYFYIGELLLLPAYRGNGLGSHLLGLIEQEITNTSRYTHVCCATVIRPDNHPLRPGDFFPIEPFCRRHGYHLLENVSIRIPWQQIDGTKPLNTLRFWAKQLPGSTA